MANPKQVYLPEKNITLEFPENTPDDAIRQIVKRDWDKLPDKRPDIGTWIGEKLAGGYETAVSPEWSAKETVKKALGGAVEALGYGTPQGMAVTFGLPFAAQAASGIAAIPTGIASAIIEPPKEKGGRDRLTAGLETATKVIEGSRGLVSKVPIIGTPISPVGETVQKAFSFVPEVVEKGIEVGQKATGGYREKSAEPLRTAVSELTSYALYGILGTARLSPTLRGSIVNKYFPNKKPVLDLPNEMYQQKYIDFRDFITKNDLNISTPETRAFAVKAYNDVLTVQRAAVKEAARQTKKAMTDPELKQVAEAVRNNRMTFQDWRDLQEFKKREYTYNIFEEAIKRGDIAKEEAEAIRQELIEQLNYKPEEGGKPPLIPNREPMITPEQERLQAIREELTRQADEARDKQIKQERMKQIEEIDRLIQQKYGKTEPSDVTAAGKSVEYRFSPDTRAGEFYDTLVSAGFTKARAEQIVNTVYPEAPKIEVVRGYRAREEVGEPEPEVEQPVIEPPLVEQPPVEVKQPEVEKPVPAEVKPENIPLELKPLAEEARKYKSAEEFVEKIRSLNNLTLGDLIYVAQDLYKQKFAKEVKKVFPLSKIKFSGGLLKEYSTFLPSPILDYFESSSEKIPEIIEKYKNATSETTVKGLELLKTFYNKHKTEIDNQRVIKELGLKRADAMHKITEISEKMGYKNTAQFLIDLYNRVVKGTAEVKPEVKPETAPTPEERVTEKGEPAEVEPEVKPEGKPAPEPKQAQPEATPKPAEEPVSATEQTKETEQPKPETKPELAYSPQELEQLRVLKEPETRSEYVDSLSKTSSPTIEDVQKAEVKQTGKKSKPRDFTDIINNERGELILGYRSVENVLQDLGVTFKKLPEPLEFFKGIKGDIRKKIMLNDTITRIFPHVREHMDILDQIERLPNKYKFEEYRSLQPFFTLKNPEKVYQFIEQLRKEGKKRSEYPITDELLDSKGFTEAEKNAIKSFVNFTHRAMDYYIRRTLLNHVRLDGGYTKPVNYTEAKELVDYLKENGEDPHIIKQAEAIARIHEQVDARANEYYFPASRYGKFYILAKTKDGNTAYLAHVDNKKDIPEIVKKLKQEHPEWEISAGENYKPKTELAYELPPHILSVIKSAIEDLDKSGALTVTGKDLLVELERMSAKWKGSFAVHLMKADLIEGWEKNLKKSVADYTHKMVKNYVYSEYIPEFRKALAKLDVHADAPLIEILKKTLDDVTSARYKFAPLGKFMFFYYLSGNFKSALVNFTQPVAITFPWAIKYVSTKEATAMFAKAYADAINYRLRKYDKLNPELKSLIDELVEREVLIAQGVKEMMGHIENIQGLKTIPQTGFEYLSLPFKEAEIMNRYHAASMFYQIGKKKGLSGEELTKFVEREGINMTQFDYSTVGLPQIARGALRPMFIFRVFALNWLSRARQLLREREYKSFATLLGTHFLLGGIGGVPMAMEFLKAIHWAYNRLADRDEAFEVDMRALGKQISEEYGSNLADYIQYGLPAFAGVTISGPINPVDMGTLDTQHPVYGLIKTITGVAPDVAVRAERAYSIWKRHSNAYRAVEAMMPEFVRNILVAYRWYDEKGATMPNGELIFTPNLFQITLKGLGLNSTEYINMLSKREAIRDLLEEHKIKTTNINERLGLALARGDMKTFTDTLNAVITQNINSIEQGKPIINIDQNAIRQHMLEILNPEAYRRVSKTLQPEVREIEEVYGGNEEE
jgi:hypothetical protein